MAYNFNFLFYCVFLLGIAEKVMTSLTSQNISFHFTNQGLFTRSKPVPYDSNLCFFCEEKAKYQNPLHLLSTSSAGSSLDNAVKQSKDPKLLVKLSTALDSTDAHAIDIKYHKSCWAKHVTGVLRKTIKDDKERSRSETAAKLEFLNLTQAALDSGEILNMAQLEQAFDSISNENNSPKTLILSK